ncbi:gap junction gamma-3 protein-like isoform X2 [Tamandua tetradactyla]
MCSRFLRRLLAEESRPSTPVGRLLLPVLLGFRVALLAAAGPGVYGDEQSEFECNTQQPGCKATCFDAMHPLSPLRFWAFQVILVAVPSALYLTFTLYHVVWHWEEPGKVREEEEALILEGERSRDAARSRRLLWAYVAQLGARLVLEGATLGVQYHLYGVHVPILFDCLRMPCPYSVTCISPRSSEKSVFLKTMLGVSGLCFFSTLLELVLLALGRWSRRLGNSLGVSLPSSHTLTRAAQRASISHSSPSAWPALCLPGDHVPRPHE